MLYGCDIYATWPPLIGHAADAPNRAGGRKTQHCGSLKKKGHPKRVAFRFAMRDFADGTAGETTLDFVRTGSGRLRWWQGCCG